MGRLKALPARLVAAPPRLKPMPKVADAFYRSPEWLAVRRAVEARDGKFCRCCGKAGVRLFADHIVEIKDGGAKLDPANVQLLCGGCHGRKTEQAKAARVGIAMGGAARV